MISVKRLEVYDNLSHAKKAVVTNARDEEVFDGWALLEVVAVTLTNVVNKRIKITGPIDLRDL